jgi:hypothetical protein
MFTDRVQMIQGIIPMLSSIRVNFLNLFFGTRESMWISKPYILIVINPLFILS